MNFAGRIKFKARYGKRVYYNLSDELRIHCFPAESLVTHMKNDQLGYRSSFCTGFVILYLLSRFVCICLMIQCKFVCES